MTITDETLTTSADYLEYSAAYINDNANEKNWIPRERLTELANYSETIEEPYIPGKFNNEQHYLNTLELVLNSTLETSNRIRFFLNEVLPIILHKESLLDVGPGDGSLTKRLISNFSKITAVDTNSYILDNFEKTLPLSINYLKIHNSILNVKLPINSYNLAILSHMLYYIEPKLWLRVIKSVYNSLKIGGVLVIVMGGDELDKANLIKNFGGLTPEIDRLALYCLRTFGLRNVSLYASDEEFVTSSKKAMFHIAAFMLADANISAAKDDLNLYIEKNFQQSENYFKMTTKQKYVVVRKQNYLKDSLYANQTITSQY